MLVVKSPRVMLSILGTANAVHIHGLESCFATGYGTLYVPGGGKFPRDVADFFYRRLKEIFDNVEDHMPSRDSWLLRKVGKEYDRHRTMLDKTRRAKNILRRKQRTTWQFCKVGAIPIQRTPLCLWIGDGPDERLARWFEHYQCKVLSTGGWTIRLPAEIKRMIMTYI